MSVPLKILLVSTECVPFAKTGGMGDVVSALPIALKNHDIDVRIVIPKYSFIDVKKYHIKRHIKSMGVQMGNTQEWCSVDKTITDDSIPVYFIEFDSYFKRNGIYHDNEFSDYPDNPKRFSFLARAALQLCKDLKFKPDIIQANDWHTALITAYLKIWHWNDPILGGIASVLTIHNIGYQGIYPKLHYDYIGLGEGNFTPDKFECFGAVNFLKGGIYFADMINTVSPSYARETKTPSGGFGLDPYLRKKEDRYIGILNGADYSQWDPGTDCFLPCNYSIDKMHGKVLCKSALQKRLGLELDQNTPIIGVISRFVSQKGLYLLSQCIESIIHNMNVQFAVLGSGDKQLEAFYGTLPHVYPGKIGSFIGYNDELAHLIEAGSDFLLIPSIYEPCGLTQIYSLKYGTLPIIRATGGLDDTVENYNEKTGDGTGFKFWEASTHSIYYTVGWAVSTFYDRKCHMKKLMKNAMKKIFSWENSAFLYIDLYNKAIEIKNNEV